ncbi:MAG: hypothetical protein ACKOF3_12730, partial [Spartobacteria bacterium]
MRQAVAGFTESIAACKGSNPSGNTTTALAGINIFSAHVPKERGRTIWPIARPCANEPNCSMTPTPSLP